MAVQFINKPTNQNSTIPISKPTNKKPFKIQTPTQ